MTAFTITVDDAQVRAELQRLQERVGNLRPVMTEIGEGIVARAKARFGSSTGPDGQRWAPNSAVTLGIVAAAIGASGRKKDGSLNARGAKNLNPLRQCALFAGLRVMAGAAVTVWREQRRTGASVGNPAMISAKRGRSAVSPRQ